ncbi:mannos-6-phosphate isomerase [Peniophora sp. CONT]|nr:mannos-6-phosphate isomerase [Peniophora sp. CONT]
MSPHPPVFTITPTAQQYDWGQVGLSSKVAQFAKATDVESIDESKPYAELWMGTHTKSPSTVEGKPLSDVLAANPRFIGDDVAKKFDAANGNLPYLFKVLAIAKALSIQSHPDKATAERLHAEQPDIYKDPNHKPEMALAISPFTALCGFQPLEEIAKYLSSTPELAQLTSITPAQLTAFTSADSPDAKSTLRALFADIAGAPDSKFKPALEQLIARYKAGKEHADERPIKSLILQLHEQFPGDIGAFCAFLLNIVHLQPGEAIFLGAGEPHAYVSGDIIECMANSDNVIRAGLTPKLRDVPNLLSTLTYNSSSSSKHTVNPTAFQGSQYTTLYDPPIPEFSVLQSLLPAGTAEKQPAVAGPSITIVTEGSAELKWESGSLNAPVGTVFFVAAGTPLEVKAGQDKAVLYRAFVEA